MGKREGERLRKAIKRMPRQGRKRGIRHFARRMEEEYPDLIGTSYPSIHSYLQGRTDPSDDFWDAAAELLRVNRQYLTEGVEPMTASHAVEEEAAEGAGGLDMAEWVRGRREATESAVQGALGHDLPAPARAVIHKAHRRLGETERFDMERAHEGGYEFSTRLAERIGEALRAPLDAFDVDPARCDTDELADYLVAVTTAVARLVEHGPRAHRQRLADIDAALTELDEEKTNG